jgi:DNA-binding HxlR family transcriptional regulator
VTPQPSELPDGLLSGWYGARVVTAGEWVPAILCTLAANPPLHYRDISRIVASSPASDGWPQQHRKLHDSTLVQTLKRLVADGLVARHQDLTTGFAPSVRYGLTDAGRDLLRAVEALALWSSGHPDLLSHAQSNRHRPARRL